MTTVYVTKYALSDGIRELPLVKEDDKYRWVKFGYGPSYGTLIHKDEGYLTLDEAQRNADVRRTKKIASLKKQIAKLEKMTFPLKTPKDEK